MTIMDLARPDLVSFKPYACARAEAGAAPVMLNANESPWPPLGTRAQGLNRYPDPQPAGLVARLAELYGVRDEQVLVGRGSDEAIDLLVRAFCRHGIDTIAIAPPTFGMYAVCATAQGVDVVSLPLDAEFRLDAAGMLARLPASVKLLFLCSPNNPTGSLVPLAAIERLAQAVRARALVIVDEAYIEFAGAPSAASVLDRHANLGILRTLSKAWALAGARVGALLASAEIVALLRRIMTPYPLPTPSVDAALAALQPGARHATHARIATMINERDKLAQALSGLAGVRRVYPSRANFLAVAFDDASGVYRSLAAQGIVVRDITHYPGLDDALRISIGTPAENARLLTALGCNAGARSGTTRPRAGEAMEAVTRHTLGENQKILFVDRDGCLIEEPADEQLDDLGKLRPMPNVIPALRRCVRAGYQLVMVTNQDGLGTACFPQADFDVPQAWLLDLLASQGIGFREVLVDVSFEHERKDTRKPGVGLVRHYLADDHWHRGESAMVGDRDTDMQFAANLGVRGLRVGAHGRDWMAIAQALCDRPRTAQIERVTRETHIQVQVSLDGGPSARIATGIGFFDHMLEQLARHGDFALDLSCEGDLHVDEHHSVEDTALALGEALRQALGDKRGIARYGFTLPMDESLASAALDLSGRACFVLDGDFPRASVGGLSTEMVEHFFRSLCDGLRANLHLAVRGDNTHHMVEACFKAVARCLRQATRREGDALPSTKGVL